MIPIKQSNASHENLEIKKPSSMLLQVCLSHEPSLIPLSHESPVAQW